jgi:hypothetical protein
MHNYKYVLLFINKRTLNNGYGFHLILDPFLAVKFYSKGVVSYQKDIEYQHIERVYAWRGYTWLDRNHYIRRNHYTLYLTNEISDCILPGGVQAYFNINSDLTLELKK